MSPHLTITTIFAIALAPMSFAEIRPWKSADGSHTLQGEFIKRDVSSVTLRNPEGHEITIALAKLHPDEIKWLSLNQSLKNSGSHFASGADTSAFFDNLTFRDTRDTTLTKLKASKIVEMTMNEAFIGRSGLNGIFRTRRKIGKLNVALYFDWTPAGKLKELTLQTDPRPSSAYRTEIEPSWKELIVLLNTLYGKALEQSSLPQVATLADGSFTPSHLWRLEGGGSALLGTAREGSNYQLVVRFTQNTTGMVEIP